jgi:hypothetical protein
MKKEFETWMTKRDNKSSSAASAYKSGINTISRHYSKETNQNIDLYTINDINFINELVGKYGIDGIYQKVGEKGHGTVRCAIAAYARFLEQKDLGYDSQNGQNPHTKSDNKKEFEEWMKERYETNTVASYKSAINTISRHYLQQKKENIDLYTINDINFINELVRKYGIGGIYHNIGEKGNGTVRCAIAAYARFLEQKRSGHDSHLDKEDTPKGNNQKSSFQNNISQQSVSVDKFEFINKVNMIILPVLAFMIILPALSKYIGKILLKRNENNWWKKYVLDKLRETRDLPKNGSKEEYINELDISACLTIIIQNWDEIFKYEMDLHSRDMAYTLLSIRNKEAAHYTAKLLSTYNYEDVNYALNTIIHFMTPIDTNIAEQISEIKREFEIKYKNEK